MVESIGWAGPTHPFCFPERNHRARGESAGRVAFCAMIRFLDHRTDY